jgi:hypothetical protein
MVAGLCGLSTGAPAQAPIVSCPQDWDANTMVSTADLNAFLADWFGGGGDYNRDFQSSTADVFDFFGDWFVPCVNPKTLAGPSVNDRAIGMAALQAASSALNVRLFDTDVFYFRDVPGNPATREVYAVDSVTQRASNVIAFVRDINPIAAGRLTIVPGTDWGYRLSGDILELRSPLAPAGSSIFITSFGLQLSSGHTSPRPGRTVTECGGVFNMSDASPGPMGASSTQTQDNIRSVISNADRNRIDCSNFPSVFDPNDPANQPPCNLQSVGCLTKAECDYNSKVFKLTCAREKDMIDCGSDLKFNLGAAATGAGAAAVIGCVTGPGALVSGGITFFIGATLAAYDVATCVRDVNDTFSRGYAEAAEQAARAVLDCP